MAHANPDPTAIGFRLLLLSLVGTIAFALAAWVLTS
jgi:hypothetical protein